MSEREDMTTPVDRPAVKIAVRMIERLRDQHQEQEHKEDLQDVLDVLEGIARVPHPMQPPGGKGDRQASRYHVERMANMGAETLLRFNNWEARGGFDRQGREVLE